LHFRAASKGLARQIEELESSRGKFLADFSHELRTPLTAIKEGLHFLKDGGSAMQPGHFNRTLDVCLNASKKLELMIQNILNHAKLEEGFYTFDDKPKDFAGVVNAAITGLRPIADRRGQAIEVFTHSNRCWGVFSAEGISHAVENILMNAIKYADSEHPISVTIRRVEGAPTPFLECKITNHGAPIPAAHARHVFERFFRAANSGGQQGIGLGLNLVKRIIEAHHGSVTVESDEGITTFSFRIPQVNEPQEASA
jgi:signal transduction histidine kinase